jgi:hypothetical protein
MREDEAAEDLAGAWVALHLHASVADALLLEWAAPSKSVVVGVLHQCTAGTPGIKVDFDRARKRMVFVTKGMKKEVGYPQKKYSSESLARRLASSFFLLPGASYPEVITAAQQATADAARAKVDAACAKANAACTKASAARPGARFCYVSARFLPFPPPLPKSSQVNTLSKAKSETRSKQNKDMHKCSNVYSERGVPLPVLTSDGE